MKSEWQHGNREENEKGEKEETVVTTLLESMRRQSLFTRVSTPQCQTASKSGGQLATGAALPGVGAVLRSLYYLLHNTKNLWYR